MSDVDVLRRAAALMRERAQSATPGPWETYSRGLQALPAIRTSDDRAEVAKPYVTGTPYGSANGEHIASWHPGVAVPIAAWLEQTADHIASWADDEGRSGRCDYASPSDGGCVTAALDAARAYLGESA